MHGTNTILDQLARVYDNPNRVQEAEDALQNVAKFERILYEAQGQNWPDVNKILTFRSGLNTSIKKALSSQLNLPRTYPDFLSVVQQLSQRSHTSVYTQPQHQSND